MSSKENAASIAGAGLGLRSPNVDEILSKRPKVGWFEVLADNYFWSGGLHVRQLEAVREHYPLTMHSVGMSLGSSDPLDYKYLAQVKHFADTFQPSLISEHLCWTSNGEHHFHDLLPLPYTQEAIEHTSRRIIEIQEFLGRRILIENVSSYLAYNDSEMSEWEFLSEIVTRADCYILLDVNNIYISSRNHNFNTNDYVQAIDSRRVKEIHLGGHEDRGNYLLDSHSACVSLPVWELYEEVIARMGAVATLIEWDNDIPALDVLVAEAEKANKVLQNAHPLPIAAAL